MAIQEDSIHTLCGCLSIQHLHAHREYVLDMHYQYLKIQRPLWCVPQCEIETENNFYATHHRLLRGYKILIRA